MAISEWGALWGMDESFREDATPALPAPEIDNDDEDIEEDEGATSLRPMGSGMVRLTEQFFGINFPNPDAGTQDDDRLFLSLDKAAPLDLPTRMQHTGQRLSLFSYRKNVRAFRAIELVTAFAWGDGPRFRASDDKVAALLQRHWIRNQWETKGPERVRELGIFGEQLYPVFPPDQKGVVRISSVSPLKIVRVKRDPENAEDITQVVTSIGVSSPHTTVVHEPEEGKIFDVIGPNEEGKLEGNAFFFAVNRLAGATRGLPDLLPSLDWLEGLDSFIFGLLERANITQNIVYDLEFAGLRPIELRKKVKEFVRALRKSGGVYAHNEKTKLNIKVPQLGSEDMETTVRILLRQIQAGTGLAGFFYGDQDDLTRASASELSVPVAKNIQARQNFIKAMLRQIFEYQIQVAQEAGKLEGVEDTSFEIQMPRVYLRDLDTIGKALTSISASLVVAVESQWLTQEEARNLFRGTVEQLGPLDDTMLNDFDEAIGRGEMLGSRMKSLELAMEKRKLVDRNGDSEEASEGTG